MFSYKRVISIILCLFDLFNDTTLPFVLSNRMSIRYLDFAMQHRRIKYFSGTKDLEKFREKKKKRKRLHHLINIHRVNGFHGDINRHVLFTKNLYFRLFQIKKPLVEKKRRERINTSLQQLKQLLLENIKLHVSILPTGIP